MAGITRPDSLAGVISALAEARSAGLPLAVAGGRHAMGGQQFCDGGLLLDTSSLDAVLDFDEVNGTIETEAGLQWPGLLAYLHEQQRDDGHAWAIAQKQTGADRLSLGGALSANVHGRGLTMKPIVSDVEAFTLVTAAGEVLRCSRDENRELFSLVAGGYGLFGVIYSIRLRLVRRRKLERVVEISEIEGLVDAFAQRIDDGFLYGDFQFAIDPESDDFLRRGVFSCYRPVDDSTPIREDQSALTREDWQKLLYLAHTDKRTAFELYARHYLGTSGQIYRSDDHQFADYVDGYHEALDAALAAPHPATEMITEVYVPRHRLSDFMLEAAEDFRKTGVDVVYGTIRLIERDDDSFLPWATQPYAGVIFNVHTVHTAEGIEHSATAFRRLIDLAIARDGSYFLTYHRWARPDQVETCYPRIREFFDRKRRYDPDEVFQSDWYRGYRGAFASS
jgi:FAD/FMN-containing dehydrogenase